jgi:uncharacterized protein (DUF1015 family)
MADVRPFRAIRYDLGRVGALSDVVAPPYDVIDPAQQASLYEKSPHNVIRLILNREEPGDAPGKDRYTRAAGFVRDWQASGVLRQDSARSLYVYHQEFEIDGQRHTRRGFLARVGLEPLGSGRIYAHEETLAGPKADRLKLFRATAMNLSPVFGLYPDPDNEVQSLLDRAVSRQLPLEAVDANGVISRLWPVEDQHVTSAVTGLMGPKPVFIADGHHRYETGLTYLQERRDAGAVTGEDSPARFILMMLVSMKDPGLLVLPTHRLVNGLGGITADQLRDALAGVCVMDARAQGPNGCREIWDLVRADGGQNVMGFGTSADQTWQLGRFRCQEEMARLVPEHSENWQRLAVSILHRLVLDDRLKGDAAKRATCQYVHEDKAVADAIGKKECDLGVLVPPVTTAHVETIAGNLEKMPPKSTYFYPKLLSGLLFNSLSAS